MSDRAASDRLVSDRAGNDRFVSDRATFGASAAAAGAAVLVLLAVLVVPAFGVVSIGHSHEGQAHEGQAHEGQVPALDPAAIGAAAYDSVAGPPLPVGVPQRRFDTTDSVATYDGSTVVSRRGETVRFDRAEADPSSFGEHRVGSGFDLRAVSVDGSAAALVRVTDNPGSETASEILVLYEAGESRVYRFDGRVEPEAFATDGQALFVIDHSVAGVPGSYRVRPLNLATGKLEQMLGPSKVPLVENMNGTARRQVWGTDPGRLYTLYIRQTDHGEGHRHASGRLANDGFVHILDLDEEWAFCLDLPAEFGKGDLATTALAVTGDTISVLDLNAGRMALASAQQRAVTSVIDLPDSIAEFASASVSASASPGGSVSPGGSASESPRGPASSGSGLQLGLVRRGGGQSVLVAAGDRGWWFQIDPAGTEARPIGEPVRFEAPVIGVSNQGSGALSVWLPAEGPRRAVPPST